MKKLPAIFTLFVLLVTSLQAQDSYTPITSKEDGRKMFRMDIRVPAKMEKQAYNDLAQKIKDGMETKYKETIIRIFLDGTGPEPFMAAKVTFSKKDFTSRVYGLPLEREADFADASTPPKGATLKGHWIDEHKGTFVWIYENGDALSMDLREARLKTSKTVSKPMVTVNIGDEVRLVRQDADPHLKPYYIINEDGSLGYYEYEKLIRVFPTR